jgi:hypothetical protein
MKGSTMRLPLTFRTTLTIVAATGLVLVAPASYASHPHQDEPAAAHPNMVVQWNEIATRTIATENLTPVPVTPLYLSFTSVAMYDSVAAIRGSLRPYALTTRPAESKGASVAAATATAAYEVLKHYFPGSVDHLDADYAASLAQVPDGSREDRGVVVGQAAARAIIELRADDGRDDPSVPPLRPTPAPGVWRPTPPGNLPMLVPWLGFVRPMVLTSPTQLSLPGPKPLASAAYARDFNEVKRMGAVHSTSRTPTETQTALFFSDNSVVQYQAGMRILATGDALGIARTARMFALVDTGTADAMISCWRAKYDYAFWRPITAIALAYTDGNSATATDAAWAPLEPTPPYPDYPSGHACNTGSVARGLGILFGADHVDLVVSSAVTGTTRHYETAAELNRQTINARIWLGLHFRTAMVDGNDLGQRAAAYVAAHAFARRSG